MLRPLIACLLLAGCGTQVVDLGPPDAGPPPFPTKFCLDMPTAGGALCQRCWNEWGVEIATTCAAGVPGNPANLCVSRPDPAFDRCLTCGVQQRGCLKCEAPGPTGCATCLWTDLPGLTCSVCTAGPGAVKDNCDALRPEVIRPTAAP